MYLCASQPILLSVNIRCAEQYANYIDISLNKYLHEKLKILLVPRRGENKMKFST